MAIIYGDRMPSLILVCRLLPAKLPTKIHSQKYCIIIIIFALADGLVALQDHEGKAI
jgi:hypothetical protein